MLPEEESGDSCDGLDLFVSGRVCLFGEHSDWAGGFRGVNPSIPVGRTIVVGTNEGVYARAKPHPSEIILTSTLENGEILGPIHMTLHPADLLKEAQKGEFWSYAAGVAYYMVTMFDVRGLELDNYRTTLPISKGLSSSAAFSVMLARAFNQIYQLKLSTRGEMEYAYLGEILTPSKCGRMDQACAYGAVPVVLTYDGDQLEVESLSVGEEVHLVIADLKAAKDTVIILQELQAGYPVASSSVEEGVHHLLGELNLGLTERARMHLAQGDLPSLGALMREAQDHFDTLGGAACPSQLIAPVLHKVMRHPKLQAHIWGCKGVGSQGDGTAQFLCIGSAGQSAVCEILKGDFDLHCLRLTIPSTDKSTNNIQKKCLSVSQLNYESNSCSSFASLSKVERRDTQTRLARIESKAVS
eukprot:CAMPEP_0196590232 /NCGR_PEP_ID=MMETSP1081-20130531/66029_1 /TAXON_ID=36882 /ORGANISM="Pyramimonas amylifera, Strain CCMP720" /LENGTH=412 /DNA_ID=CAMNT_0041913279 /DNA_START=135 /DNA_END=1373 /DNA_ORIENTATION=+